MRIIFLLVVSLLTLPVYSADLINQQYFQMATGDHPQWSSPAWNDQNWRTIHLGAVPQPDGILWLRAWIRLEPENFVPTHPLGLQFAALASHEIYWDGVLIGRGGNPGQTAEEEIPGPIQAHYVIPEHLAKPGDHLVAVRTSAHHRHFKPATGYWALFIGDYDTLIHLWRQVTSASLMSLSGMLLVAVFALLLFLIDRGDRSYLLLCLIAIVSALLLIAEAWRNVYGYTYNYHLLRLVIIHGLSILLSLLILLFMMTRFPGSHRSFFVILALAGSVAASLTAPGWDNKSLYVFILGFALSLLWTLRAAFQKKRGSLVVMTGLIATFLLLFWRPHQFADLNLYFGINFLLLCLLSAHVLQVRQVRLEREEARIKSARLEIELLKKHIQPHYLMNTLTALAEWIEQQPKEAVKMIQALSEEFRVLSEVSHRSLIPLKEEMRLCSAHLEIMSRRKGATYEITTEGIDPEALIPPALIHTLVENAVVHNPKSSNSMRFELTGRRQDGFVYYTFKAPCEESSVEFKEGTGFRYIKTRLAESYGTSWHFHSGREGNFWKTELRIPLK